MIAVVEQHVSTSIHWEAVLLTAIPATLSAVVAIVTAFIAKRAASVGQQNKQHLVAIDKAVNGVPDGDPTLREQVSAINQAVNGAAEGEPSIRQNIETLTDRRDLDPNVVSSSQTQPKESTK